MDCGRLERWAPLDPLNNPFANEKGDEECDTKLRWNVTRYSTLTDDPHKIAQLVLSHPIKHKTTHVHHNKACASRRTRRSDRTFKCSQLITCKTRTEMLEYVF